MIFYLKKTDFFAN